MTADETRFVYFIRRADGVGPVKIGCSISPDTRLSTLSAWSPYPLMVAAKLVGDQALERRFHEHFKDQRSHSEWFHPSDELEQLLQQVASDTFDVAVLPSTGKRLKPPQANLIAEMKALEIRASKLRLRMTHVLAANGIAPSTWWRWRHGKAAPRPSKLREVARAIEDAA